MRRIRRRQGDRKERGGRKEKVDDLRVERERMEKKMDREKILVG